jgi:hypothetical protein
MSTWQVNEIKHLLADLRQDRALSPEDRVRLQDVIDLFQSAYQDHIITILLPLLWKLRERLWAVTKATSDAGLAEAIKFFSDAQFTPKVMVGVREICHKARADALESKRKGLEIQESGLDLFLISNEMLESAVYPNVETLLRFISKKAHTFHPMKDRSFVRICVNIVKIVDSLKEQTDQSGE